MLYPSDPDAGVDRLLVRDMNICFSLDASPFSHTLNVALSRGSANLGRFWSADGGLIEGFYSGDNQDLQLTSGWLELDEVGAGGVVYSPQRMDYVPVYSARGALELHFALSDGGSALEIQADFQSALCPH